MRKWAKIILFGIPLVVLLSYLFYWRVRTGLNRVLFDYWNEAPKIENPNEVQEWLTQFEIKGIESLPKDFVTYSKMLEQPYRKMHQKAKFYVVPIDQVYQKVIGNHRIEHFLPKDEFFKKALLLHTGEVYWRLDELMLQKLLLLKQLLQAKGYDPDGFTIRNGYRHPRYNEERGGARKSRHLYGEAIDLVIQDINRDGKYTSKDKDIVLEILENQVIKNEGGIGRYPKSRTIHMDVRGYKARWDSY